MRFTSSEAARKGAPRWAAIVLPAIVLVTVVGCAGIGSANDPITKPIISTTDSSTSVPGSAATSTAEPVVGDTDGDGKVTGAEQIRLDKNKPRDYPMADGSVVQVDPTQPLPAAVVTELIAKLAPSFEKLRSPNYDTQVAGIGDIGDMADAAGRAAARDDRPGHRLDIARRHRPADHLRLHR